VNKCRHVSGHYDWLLPKFNSYLTTALL